MRGVENLFSQSPAFTIWGEYNWLNSRGKETKQEKCIRKCIEWRDADALSPETRPDRRKQIKKSASAKVQIGGMRMRKSGETTNPKEQNKKKQEKSASAQPRKLRCRCTKSQKPQSKASIQTQGTKQAYKPREQSKHTNPGNKASIQAQGTKQESITAASARPPGTRRHAPASSGRRLSARRLHLAHAAAAQSPARRPLPQRMSRRSLPNRDSGSLR